MTPEDDKEIMAGFLKGVLIGPSDPYTKLAVLPDGSICYFPLFKPRFEVEMSEDPSASGKHLVGVEWRALPAIDPTWPSFSAHASRDLYQYYVQEAIVCSQKPIDKRSAVEQQRAELWEEFNNSWMQILSNHKLSPIQDEEKYVRLDTTSNIFHLVDGALVFDPDSLSERVSKNMYGAFLGILRLYAQQHPSFEKEVKELISKFEREVAATLA
jgi:hypothetical protein